MQASTIRKRNRGDRTAPQELALVATLATAAILATLAAPLVAEAGGRCRGRHASGGFGRFGGFGTAYSYGVLKAGGYSLDTIAGNDDSPREHHSDLDGLFLGLEWGVSPSPFVEMGFTVDWLHRDRAERDVVVFDAPYDLPVSGNTERTGTSTNLVPLGGLLRLRMPVAEGRFVPYVSGQLTWDVLRLEYRETVNRGDTLEIHEESEYFRGWGQTLAVGLETNLDAGFGVVVEAGSHRSEPSRAFVLDGVPVDGVVDAGGEFARIGMRFAFR